MPEIALPASGKRRHFNSTTKQSDIVFLVGIKCGDIADPYTVFAFFDEFDRITHSDSALLQHREIETRALARKESFDDVRAAESDAELVTGHARLGRHHHGRADAKFVTNIYLGFKKPRGREVLAEHAPG